MLMYIGIAEVQVLMAAMACLLLYAGLLTLFLRRWLLLAVIGMAGVFAVGYVSLRASDSVVGRPVWMDGEVTGMLGGYLQFQHKGKDWIAILIKTEQGPRLLAVPYTPRDNEQIQQAMENWIKLGQAQIMRKKSDGVDGEPGNGKGDKGGEGSQQGGQLEFYEFNQDFLQPKVN